ncbi:MAG: ABC transporter substrate-binding protein, partial [Roseovarius indicus]
LTPDDMARDEELSDALIAATKTVDQDARQKSYDFATSRIVDELYWQPMWTNPATYAYDADLAFTPFPDENPRFFLVGWND